MGQFPLIFVLAAVTYGTRLSGLLLGRRAVPEPVERFLAYVPAAVFAALVTANLNVPRSELPPRLLGLLIAGAVVWRFRQLWAGLAAGMAVYWIVRALV